MTEKIEAAAPKRRTRSVECKAKCARGTNGIITKGDAGVERYPKGDSPEETRSRVHLWIGALDETSCPNSIGRPAVTLSADPRTVACREVENADHNAATQPDRLPAVIGVHALLLSLS